MQMQLKKILQSYEVCHPGTASWDPPGGRGVGTTRAHQTARVDSKSQENLDILVNMCYCFTLTRQELQGSQNKMAQSNDRNIHLTNSQLNLPVWAHPEVVYWTPEWKMIRDAILGEKQIKSENTLYLPQPEGLDDGEYEAYLHRAVFYNMVSRTVTGLTGTLFRRKPVIDNLPKTLDTKRITKDGQDLNIFAKEAAREIISMGRYGVLLDMDKPEKGKNKIPFFAGYLAENIQDWEEEVIDGFTVATNIVLREIKISRQQSNYGFRGSRQYYAQYRVLSLDVEDDGSRVYRQYLYQNDERDADPESDEPTEILTPTNRGKPFDYIPFIFFGPFSNVPAIDKPPSLDITNLNISHYQSYAHLEHGRFFTGVPTYFVPVSETGDDGQQTYEIGSARVWEVASGDKPGILEFFGSGLRFLENALDQKEMQVSNLGGRMLGVRAAATAESDNQVALTEKNEKALLLNVANTLDAGLTKLLMWWAKWQDVSEKRAEKISLAISKEFLLDIGARELRAVQAMYKDGLIPLEVLYEYLRKSEVVPDHMSLDEFRKLLEDATKSFPNQPDVEAKSEGFPDAKSRLDVKEAEKDRKEAEKDRKQAEKQPLTRDAAMAQPLTRDAALAQQQGAENTLPTK